METQADQTVSRLLPSNDRERERFVNECRELLRQMGFTVIRIGHRSWLIERSLSTSSMCSLAKTMQAKREIGG